MKRLSRFAEDPFPPGSKTGVPSQLSEKVAGLGSTEGLLFGAAAIVTSGNRHSAVFLASWILKFLMAAPM
jgi:hypothetical protein